MTVWALLTVGTPIESLAAGLPDWLSWLTGVLVALAWLVVLLIGAWLAVLVTSVAGGPLFSELAARIETSETGQRPPGSEGIAKTIAGSVWRELGKVAYHVPRFIALLLLSLIPGIGVLAAPLTFLFSAWMLALQFADLVFENHARPFRETRKRLRERLGPTLGFGLPAVLLLSVPIVNLLLMPAVAAGGSLLAIHLRTGDGSGPLAL